MRRILTRTNPMPDLVAMSNLVFTAPAAFSLASSSSLERLSDPPATARLDRGQKFGICPPTWVDHRKAAEG